MASIQVIEHEKNSKFFEISIEALETLLLHDNVKDREIVAISITGAYRKGKSFLLNFLLRYLYETVSKLTNKLFT